MDHLYTTKNLYLRLLDEASAPLVLSFAEQNKQYFQPWEPFHPERFYTISYQTALMTAEHNLYRHAKAIRYFVFEKEHPDTIIGSINFYNIMPSPDFCCQFGYKLACTSWGKGYAYEAISSLLPLIFKTFRLNRIEANIMPINTRSLNLIKKLGFTYEGTARKCCEVNGIFQDHLRFSLLVTDAMPEIRI